MNARKIDLGSYQILYTEAGPVATNLYILLNTESGEAVVFDTPPNSQQFIDAVLEQFSCKLTDIYLTHSHWDHFGDAMSLKRKHGCDIWVNPRDEYRLLDPNKYIGFPIPIEFEVTVPDKHLGEKGTMNILGKETQLLHVPGHTEGSICFVLPDEKIVIAGDTLFKGSVGRTDLHGGDQELLFTSIKEKLFALPDDYTVLSGHGPETTIGFEKKYNQFVGESAGHIGL